MNAELYYPLVTEAIRRAEILEDLKAPGTAAAYLDVSLLEEKIAEGLPASDPEGAVARRGAVRAALSARDVGRARELTVRFLAEDDVDNELREELVSLWKKAEGSSAARFDTFESYAYRSAYLIGRLSFWLVPLILVNCAMLVVAGLLASSLPSQPLTGALQSLTYALPIVALIILGAFFYSYRRLKH